MLQPSCPHLGQIQTATPNSDGCEECLASGDSWPLGERRVNSHVGGTSEGDSPSLAAFIAFSFRSSYMSV